MSWKWTSRHQGGTFFSPKCLRPAAIPGMTEWVLKTGGRSQAEAFQWHPQGCELNAVDVKLAFSGPNCVLVLWWADKGSSRGEFLFLSSRLWTPEFQGCSNQTVAPKKPPHPDKFANESLRCDLYVKVKFSRADQLITSPLGGGLWPPALPWGTSASRSLLQLTCQISLEKLWQHHTMWKEFYMYASCLLAYFSTLFTTPTRTTSKRSLPRCSGSGCEERSRQ